jgi:glutamate formiminotransferase/formiminotetrahydrofolate cyclodeaminase
MAITLQSLQLEKFLDSIASANPIPGGGSSAALAGAISAGLIAMVCRVTMKSQHGAENDDLVAHQLETANLSEHSDPSHQVAALGRVTHRADELRGELMALIELDGDSYRRVIEAHKTKQPEAIQAALIYATEIPLRTAALCDETLTLAAFIARNVKRNALSDLSVGALVAQAGLRGAVVTAESNLRDIQDAKFVADQRARIAQMIENAEKNLKQVLAEK